MPKLKPKPVPKPKASVPVVLKPKVVNYRHEPLKQFVTKEQYDKIKSACNALLHTGLDITLRRVWAVVDHLVNVNDGRETEVSYADHSKVESDKPNAGTKPKARLSS